MLDISNSQQRNFSMQYVTSNDGTRIAFEKSGTGPAVILVVGAFNDHMTGLPLAQQLAPHFTVYNYDRRGRGESSDTLPYAVEREVEDLEALIAEAGGSASVFGYSSGAALVLKAAVQGLAINRMALYEPPLIVDTPSDTENQEAGTGRLSSYGAGIEVSHNHRLSPHDLAIQLAELIAQNRRGDAVELFQAKGIGMPMEIVVQMRHAPFRPALEKMAHTLVYEMTILDVMAAPTTLAASIETPTLLMAGSESPIFLQNTAKALAMALPHGQHRILPDQTHDINPSVVGPLVEAFFTQSAK
jgi:pimeloyl-ACP methyl ester carboxylesterase